MSDKQLAHVREMLTTSGFDTTYVSDAQLRQVLENAESGKQGDEGWQENAGGCEDNTKPNNEVVNAIKQEEQHMNGRNDQGAQSTLSPTNAICKPHGCFAAWLLDGDGDDDFSHGGLTKDICRPNGVSQSAGDPSADRVDGAFTGDQSAARLGERIDVVGNNNFSSVQCSIPPTPLSIPSGTGDLYANNVGSQVSSPTAYPTVSEMNSLTICSPRLDEDANNALLKNPLGFPYAPCLEPEAAAQDYPEGGITTRAQRIPTPRGDSMLHLSTHGISKGVPAKHLDSIVGVEVYDEREAESFLAAQLPPKEPVGKQRLVANETPPLPQNSDRRRRRRRSGRSRANGLRKHAAGPGGNVDQVDDNSPMNGIEEINACGYFFNDSEVEDMNSHAPPRPPPGSSESSRTVHRSPNGNGSSFRRTSPITSPSRKAGQQGIHRRHTPHQAISPPAPPHQGNKSFMSKSRSPPAAPGRCARRHDPVARYHQMQSQWASRKFIVPGSSRSGQVRKNKKTKGLGRSAMSPNTGALQPSHTTNKPMALSSGRLKTKRPPSSNRKNLRQGYSNGASQDVTNTKQRTNVKTCDATHVANTQTNGNAGRCRSSKGKRGYVVPTSKRRDKLRWQIRAQMLRPPRI